MTPGTQRLGRHQNSSIWSFYCNLPDKFVAGGIIAKLPPSWSNFATTLKHKRQEFSISDLIGSLDVEEKARAKDTRARVAEAGSSAHVVQKKNFQQFHKPKHNKGKSEGKGKSDDRHKPKQPTNFKKIYDLENHRVKQIRQIRTKNSKR